MAPVHDSSAAALVAVKRIFLRRLHQRCIDVQGRMPLQPPRLHSRDRQSAGTRILRSVGLPTRARRLAPPRNSTGVVPQGVRMADGRGRRSRDDPSLLLISRAPRRPAREPGRWRRRTPVRRIDRVPRAAGRVRESLHVRNADRHVAVALGGVGDAWPVVFHAGPRGRDLLGGIEFQEARVDPRREKDADACSFGHSHTVPALFDKADCPLHDLRLASRRSSVSAPGEVGTVELLPMRGIPRRFPRNRSSHWANSRIGG